MHICKYVYDEQFACPHCMESETVVNCRDLPTTSDNKVGEAIVGDLKKYGWVVMRGLTIDLPITAGIN